MPAGKHFQYDEEGPDDVAYDEGPTLWKRAVKVGFGGALLGWGWLLANYPNVWAYTTGGVLLIGLGFFTARFAASGALR